MAWLGSTFGDGLTSLKGQISKITKDVLAEDPLGSTSFEGRIKELEEICEAQALENKKLREESLVSDRSKSFEWSDDQFQDVCALETQVSELRAENKRLEKLVEDYDTDYQKELENILKDRDQWKKIAQKSGPIDAKITQANNVDELTLAINQLHIQNKILTEEGKKREKELAFYKNEVSRLEQEGFVKKATNNNGAEMQALENICLKTADSKNYEEEIVILKRSSDEKDIRITELVEELQRLRSENIKLSNEKEAMDWDNSSLMMEKAELEESVQNLQRSVDELQTILRKERQSISELNAKNSELLTVLNKLQLDKETVESNLTNVIETIQSKNVNLVQKLTEMESGSVNEHCEYTGIIDGLKEEKAVLTDKCEGLLEEISSLKRYVEDLEGKGQKQLTELASLQQESFSLRQKLDNSCQELVNVTSLLDAARSASQSSVIESKHTEGEENKLRERIKTLESLHEEAEQRAAKSYLIVETLNTENASLKKTLLELEASSASKVDIESLTEELDSFQEQMRSLTLEMKEKDNQLRKLSEGTGKLSHENESLVKKLEELNNGKETVLLKAEIAQQLDQIRNLIANGEEKDRISVSLRDEINVLSQKNTQLKSLTQQNSSELGRLAEELATLQQHMSLLSSERNELSESVTNLSQENEELQRQLQEIRSHYAGKIPVALEWMSAIEEEAVRLAGYVSAVVPEPMDLISCLHDVSGKVCLLLAEQSSSGNNALGLEIRTLKGLVNRIKGEFMLSNTEIGQFETNTGPESFDDQGENAMSQSQTDDVKRLKQDIAQMTEILGMIDRGLANILQDKSNLEKELAVLLSMSSKTEKELKAAALEKDSWNEEKRQLQELLKGKESEVELLLTIKTSAEQEIAAGKINTLEMEKTLKTILDENNRYQAQTKLLEELSKENHLLKEQLLNFEIFSGKQAKEIEELASKLMTKQASKEPETSETDPITAVEKVVDTDEILKVEFKESEESKKIEDASPVKTELEDMISRLQNENTDLKCLIQQLRDNIFAMANKPASDVSSDGHLQHRRSLSNVVVDSSGGGVEAVRAELEQERCRNQALLSQNQALIEKETSLRKELERLREHLVEVEEHYTAEALETEQAMNECRSKLSSAEDQLRNSSTVYKSANVRSTQHLEALQNQIKLMSVQRDDLQAKLSIAEDQMQKQSAALASLQMVLEQFQLDKDRELQSAAMKSDYQLQLAKRRSAELEGEINSLNNQLSEAKNGLKAAQRLGEQLDKKSMQISLLEDELKKSQIELSEANKSLAAANESTAAKIDKFLVKNLLLGYLSAGQGNTKAQALKILSTVLGLTEDEKAKVGVDGQSGWFSNILHPSPGGSSANSEPLSQAFIRFLESESRPQPQLKLLPESSAMLSAKRPPVLSDLVLPTMTPTQVSDNVSSSALNDVLKDS